MRLYLKIMFTASVGCGGVDLNDRKALRRSILRMKERFIEGHSQDMLRWAFQRNILDYGHGRDVNAPLDAIDKTICHPVQIFQIFVLEVTQSLCPLVMVAATTPQPFATCILPNVTNRIDRCDLCWKASQQVDAFAPSLSCIYRKAQTKEKRLSK
jgi:hypothetical protein